MKRFLLLLSLAVGIATAFGLGYGSTSEAYPAGGVYGRAEYRGYFLGNLDSAGTYVLPRNYNNSGVMEAFPGYINTAQEFIDFVRANLVNPSNTQQKTGAAFIVNTMINTPGVSSVKPPTPAQLTLWENTVRTAEAHGRVTWRANFSYTINSYYQGPTGGCSTCPDNDNAFYDETGTAASMIFRDAAGNIRYVLKWLCANPLGPGLTSLPLPSEAFGTSTVSDPNPDPGDTPTAISTRPGDELTFRHEVRNAGPAVADLIYYRVIDPINGTTVVPTNTSGPYTSGQIIPLPTAAGLKVTVPLSATAGTQFCQHIEWFWRTSWDPNWGVSPRACATVVGNYNLNPTINAQINGGPVIGAAEPGDTISFTYAVNNSGTTASSGTNCTALGQTFTGHHATPAPPEVLSTPVGGMGCPRNFAVGATTLTTETVTATANSTVCRTLSVNPATPGGGSVISLESCVLVASKPYARVYGGDLSIGGGVVTSPDALDSCSMNAGAGIFGWNQRTAGSWAGAGVQFAAYAMYTIFDTSTSLGNAGGAAAAPTGLSFANTGTDANNGIFGTSLGTAGCIPDYYAGRPASTLSVPGGATIGSLTTGIYGVNGNISFSGSGAVDPGERITVYVNGDVYLNTNVTYGGSWTSAAIPNFRLIARGNIFVDRNTSRLDGLYVAQANGSSGGVIYTCADAATPYTPLPLSGTLASYCDNAKLTVNGSLVARQVQLLRTIGTLRSSSAGETAGGNMAEVFNYSPGIWIPQPSSEDSSGYDAITSLPPIL